MENTIPFSPELEKFRKVGSEFMAKGRKETTGQEEEKEERIIFYFC